jgi:hypothetical protein
VKKYLRVITETPYQEITSYQELTGEESETELADYADGMFHNECNYGYSVVDESEVPEDER